MEKSVAEGEHFVQKIAWVLILAGTLFLGYNIYHWWGESSIAEHNPRLAKSVDPDWNDQTAQPAMNRGIKLALPATKQGENIGKLIIPKLGLIIPVVKGTDQESLKKGVGLYQGHGTVNPGETGHVVLSGHRDTVFRDLGKLQNGDRLYIEYGDKIFTYQIRKHWITDAEDRSVIVPRPDPVLTVTTCYPFDFVGDAPDRYIIRAELIGIKAKPSVA